MNSPPMLEQARWNSYVQPCSFCEEQAFLSSLPLASLEKHLYERSRRNVLTLGAASCYPFTSYEMCDEKKMWSRWIFAASRDFSTPGPSSSSSTDLSTLRISMTLMQFLASTVWSTALPGHSTSRPTYLWITNTRCWISLN